MVGTMGFISLFGWGVMFGRAARLVLQADHAWVVRPVFQAVP